MVNFIAYGGLLPKWNVGCDAEVICCQNGTQGGGLAGRLLLDFPPTTGAKELVHPLVEQATAQAEVEDGEAAANLHSLQYALFQATAADANLLRLGGCSNGRE